MAIYESKNSYLGFNKSFCRYNKDLTFHAHLHKSFELLRVKEGSVRVKIENNEYVLIKGQQILILPDLIHSYQTEKGGSLTQFIIFSTEHLPEIYEYGKSGTFFDPVLDNETFEIFDRLLEYRKDHFLFRSELYKIASYYIKNERTEMKIDRSGDFVGWLSDYLEKHCTEEINEKSVAHAIGYHPRYLSSLINKNFGVSFKVLLNEYRIKYATELLADREKSITEIYTFAGFESQSSFNRNFKLIMGMTPREYLRSVKS